MTSKKPSIFSRIFSKKSSKESELPPEPPRDFHRTQSVRGSHRRPVRNSHVDAFSPELQNPYHGNVRPRMHPKGPQSCPGGYREEDRYHDESYEENRSYHAGRMQGRHEKFRRSARDTSEYGSGDPSPIANVNRHINYNASLIEDSDPEDYGYSRDPEMMKQMDNLKARLNRAQERKEYYKTQCRKLKMIKDEAEAAYADRVQSLKHENDNLRHTIGVLKRKQEESLHQQQYSNYPPFTFSQQSQMFQPTGPFSQPTFNTFAYNHQTPRGMPPMMNSSGITPGTSSTLESSLTAGAGEALVQQNDLSFRPNSSIHYDSSFSHQDEDDIKNFSSVGEDDKIEMSRAEISSSSLGLPYHEVRLIHDVKRFSSRNSSLQVNDSHTSNSTMVADSPSPAIQRNESMRRTASDGMLN